ncbi:MAG: methylaspartate mutase subunit E [Fusobacterium sp.]|nr:methylaspartate mutase subunit E [Fusobacterium sp.]
MIFNLKKMEDNLFLEKRKEILKNFKIDIDMETAIKFHRYLPEYKNFTKKIDKNFTNKKVATQISLGSVLYEENLELISSFSKNEGVDFLAINVDAFSKENKFENVERAIEESKKSNKAILNGYPIVNYGIEKTRKLVNESGVPLQLRHGSTNPKLLVEVALASGISSIEGGGISHNIPFSKSVSLEESIENWKYVDRLIAFYEENGISIHREPNSNLTATLVPPAIANSIQILECLLAIEQGVKNISLSCSQNGNLIQDIACLKALKESFNEYFSEFLNEDIKISTVFYQWIGGVPNDAVKSYGIISYATLVAKLARADRIYIKNPEEFSTNYLNVSLKNTVDLTKSILELTAFQEFGNNDRVECEKKLIKKETKLIMDKILELSKGELSKGIIEAFKLGIIDVPFAPSKYNLGKMMPARDNEGMIRYLDIGNLPFDEEIKEFHRKKLEERALRENREINFQMTVDDIFSLSTGQLSSSSK